ncbi:hypothetical protein [Sphingomonas oryzagri]
MELNFIGRKTRMGVAAVGLLVIGGAAGAAAIEATRPAVEMAPMTPVAIARLAQTSGPITLRGRVAEVYGNKFVLDDGSGKALVDTGPRGDDGALVALGAATTVQGRYERGFVHASFLVDAGGNVTQLGPIGGPPPHDRRGPPPHGGPDRGPPPPPGTDDGAPPPPPPPAVAASASSADPAPALAPAAK